MTRLEKLEHAKIVLDAVEPLLDRGLMLQKLAADIRKKADELMANLNPDGKCIDCGEDTSTTALSCPSCDKKDKLADKKIIKAVNNLLTNIQ